MHKNITNKLLFFASYISQNSTQSTITEKALIRQACAYLIQFHRTDKSTDELEALLAKYTFKARSIIKLVK